MTTLQDAILISNGKVFIQGNLNSILSNSHSIEIIIGTLTSTLKNSTVSSSVTGNYLANIYINEYLVGKGLYSYTFNSRYFFYHITIELQTAIDNIPSWMLIEEYYPPVWK